MPYVSVIIAAAGVGRRMDSQTKKPYMRLGGEPILYHCVRKFARVPEVGQIVVAVHADELPAALSDAALHGLASCVMVVEGGERRQDSVFNALRAVHLNADVVLVHDAARPLVMEDVISRVIDRAEATGAAIAAVPLKATLKEVGEDMRVRRTHPRERLWLAQTPQGFRLELLRAAYTRAREEEWIATDDAQIVERYGHPVEIVPDRDDNIKITTPADLRIAQTLFSHLLE